MGVLMAFPVRAARFARAGRPMAPTLPASRTMAERSSPPSLQESPLASPTGRGTTSSDRARSRRWLPRAPLDTGIRGCGHDPCAGRSASRSSTVSRRPWGPRSWPRTGSCPDPSSCSARRRAARCCGRSRSYRTRCDRCDPSRQRQACRPPIARVNHPSRTRCLPGPERRSYRWCGAPATTRT